MATTQGQGLRPALRASGTSQVNTNTRAITRSAITCHPAGLRQYIENWEQAAPAFARRLQREALAQSLLPVLPLELNIGGLELSLFSVISTFGTPQDITTDELRIEAFYPANGATAEFFRGAARPA